MEDPTDTEHFRKLFLVLLASCHFIVPVLSHAIERKQTLGMVYNGAYEARHAYLDGAVERSLFLHPVLATAVCVPKDITGEHYKSQRKEKNTVRHVVVLICS